MTTTTTNPRKILIVTSNLKSHPYACIKLATILAEQHHVTLAAPNGSALSRIQTEFESYHEHTTSKNKIDCISIGDVAPCHVNVRPVINPTVVSSPLLVIANALFNPWWYNPYPVPGAFESVMDGQVSIYENIKKILPDYDLVYAIHSIAATVFDAVEALQQDHPSLSVPQCIQFSSTPYELSFIQDWLWKKPRSLVAFPHVALYGDPNKVLKHAGLIAYLIQLFWMWMDTYFAERAWCIAGKRNDKRRAERGLPAVYIGSRYYWKSYPLLSIGGIEPYLADDYKIAENATVVGSIRSKETADLKRLNDWIIRARTNKIVYASFGTGTQLSDTEASNLAKLALSFKDTNYCLLLSLQQCEQERLRPVFDKAMGTTPSSVGKGVLEYMDKFRIDDDVPQENLLLSGKVEVFVSHMGFGGFIEGVNGGVRFVSYPSGCDQWFNAERAVDAGIAIKAKPQMDDLIFTVFDAINSSAMKQKSRQLALDTANFDSNKIILDMANDVLEGEHLNQMLKAFRV